MIPTSDLKLTLDAPYHQCKYTPYSSLYISLGADKENLINNLDLFFDGDHFLYSSDLIVWFRGDIVRRK